MSIARNLERRLERFVDGMAARVFRGALHPVELANRLVREADLTEFQSLSGPTVPNKYRVGVETDEMPDARELAALERELSASIEETAAERGWRLEGPVIVSVDADLQAGKVITEVIPGDPTRWGTLTSLEDGQRHSLRYNRTMVGRAADTDLRLQHPQVSRYHALLWREARGVWLLDLESSNGTIAAGKPAVGEPAEAQTGETVIFGPLSFRLDLDS